jgi:predicted nuclease with TOPRIM domain
MEYSEVQDMIEALRIEFDSQLAIAVNDLTESIYNLKGEIDSLYREIEMLRSEVSK